MGVITEQSSFDATVYQWELTDPVVGGSDGIANLPLRNLANRTRFLNDGLSAVQQSVAAKAPTNSPTFTGTPQAPNPSAGAVSTELVTAQWVRGLAGGYLSVPLAGNYTLTIAQAAAATYYVNGATSGQTFLFFPDSLIGRWTVINDTPYALLVRHVSGGAAVTVAARKTQTLFSDGVNIGQCHNDYDSIALSGAPTTTLPLVGDNSARIPNTAWVTAAVAAEASLRDAADTKIRSDVANGYATIAQLGSESGQRVQGDTDVRTWVTANFSKRANSAQTARSNFVPGDATDNKTGASFTSGDQGGTLFIAASANITSSQQPGNAYLRILINNGIYFEEYTNGPMTGMVGIAVGASTTFLVQAQYLTSNLNGGAWKQTGLNLSFHFVAG